jgi:hypothetical protein
MSSHVGPDPDLSIAATALFHYLTLVARNSKDSYIFLKCSYFHRLRGGKVKAITTFFFAQCAFADEGRDLAASSHLLLLPYVPDKCLV